MLSQSEYHELFPDRKLLSIDAYESLFQITTDIGSFLRDDTCIEEDDKDINEIMYELNLIYKRLTSKLGEYGL